MANNRRNASPARPSPRKASAALATTPSTPSTPTDDPPTSAPRTSLSLVTTPAAPAAIVTSDVTPHTPVVANNEADRHTVGFVDLEGKARAMLQADQMRLLNHPVANTKWPIGYTVDETGVANARKFRAEVDDMPIYHEALGQLIGIVKAEDRHDLVGKVRDIRANPDGTWVTTGEFKEICGTDPETQQPIVKLYPAGFVVKPEELALIDFAADIKAALPPGSPLPDQLSRALISSPPMLRAQIVNFWQEFNPADHGISPPMKLIPGTFDKGDQLVPVEHTDKVRKIRTRKINGETTAYATVGEEFPPIDVDMVAAIANYACLEITKASPGADLRARADYDGRNVRITIISHSTVDPRLYVAGEVFRASAFLGTDDTGGGAIWGYGALDRNLCRNLIILQSSKAGAFRIEHRGRDMKAIIRELVEGVKNAFASVAVFADLWSTACEDALYLPQGVTEAPKVIREAAEVFALNAAALVTKRDRSGKHMLSMRGSSDASRVEHLVPDLLKMWKKELGEPSSAILNHNGLTRAAMVNSFTRYAHEIEGDAFRGSELEKEAGDLLTAKPWKLPTNDQWNDWGTTPEAVVAASGI